MILSFPLLLVLLALVFCVVSAWGRAPLWVAVLLLVVVHLLALSGGIR